MISDESLIGRDIKGHQLVERYTEWEELSDVVSVARFNTAQGQRVIVSATLQANGDQTLDVHRM